MACQYGIVATPASHLLHSAGTQPSRTIASWKPQSGESFPCVRQIRPERQLLPSIRQSPAELPLVQRQQPTLPSTAKSTPRGCAVAAMAPTEEAPALLQAEPRIAEKTLPGYLKPESEETLRSPVEEIKALRLITAIKTPYLPDGRFDLKAYDELVHHQVANGVEGLVVGGTTGEGQLMSWDEHIMLIAHTVNCFGNRIKVIGNTGSNCTREAIHATEQGFAVGMHGSLQINPYYGKTSLEGIKQHFSAVLSLGPGIIYNVPGRTGQDIPPTLIHSLAEQQPDNFAGVKECVGNERVQAYTSAGISIWSGNDDEAHDARWDHNARGAISVLSNLVPGLSRRLLIDGRDSALNAQLQPLAAWLFVEPNPIGLNTALAMLGLIRPIFRLPYVPLSMPKRREFVHLVNQIGIEHFVGSEGVRLLEDKDFTILSRY
eukprot:TRINITY_DN33047_c0_g1_i1.p1 TRINITY_DN33047_c0_g1~~TRINITY_DN33047_c0_g1_i1.p1  ORF type:complete len:469 (+),score=71.74 TRINITY_DN33047_c0_g1_i1:114-1409(+)